MKSVHERVSQALETTNQVEVASPHNEW